MIQPLRRIHRRIFFLLMIVLPVFFVAGILARHRVLRSSAETKSGDSANPAAENGGASKNLRAGAVR